MWDWLVTFVFYSIYRNRMRGLVAFRYEYVLFEDWLHLDMMWHSKIGQIRVCVVRRLDAFGCVPIKDWMHSGVCRSKIGCIRVCAVWRLMAFSHASFEDWWFAYPTTSRTSESALSRPPWNRKKIRNHFCLIMGLGGVFFNQIIRVSKISWHFPFKAAAPGHRTFRAAEHDQSM